MTPEELKYIGDLEQARIRTKAIQGLNEDSDAAAQAVDLEKSTGADAQMIYGNRDAFVSDYKSYLTERMLDRNPGLAGYINSHPMAAIVSKDDWNRMADFYDHLDYWLGTDTNKITKAIAGAAYGYTKGVQEGMTGPLSEPSAEDQKAVGPYITEAWKGFKAVPETALRLLAALTIHGAAGAGEGAALALGATPTTARRVKREFGGVAEYAFNEMVGTGFHGPTAQAISVARFARDLDVAVPKAVEAIRLAEPYFKAGEMPPVGTHPVWDAVIGEDVKQRMSVYDALVEGANDTKTKAISPDMIERAIALKTKEDVFLHWDAVQKLYGDKLPEPGDGLLGDVPGVAEQFRNAVDTASDVQMPLATWLSKVPDEIVKALHDDIRFRPGEPTLREAKDLPPLSEAVNDLAKPVEPAAAATPLALPEEPLTRLTRLREEYTDRLTTHGAVEHAPSSDGNLLQSLEAVTRKEYTPEDVSKAVRWSYLNERSDIVARAVEMARLSDPQLYARLQAEITNLDRYKAAQDAIILEMAQRPLFPVEQRPTEVRLQRPVKPRLTPSVLKGEHSFDITDQNGIAVASLEVTTSEGGKTINIDWIGRLHGTYEAARPTEWMLGPKNLRNLITDLIREFPNAETLAGDRVSRARTFKPEGPPEIVKIDLNKLRKEAEKPSWDIAEPSGEWKSLQDLIASGEWERIGETTVIKATDEWTRNEQKVIQSLHELLGQIAPEAAVQLRPALEARMGKPPTPIQGAYISYRDKNPIIVVAVNALNPTGTIRHELVHFLRDFDFFKREEWGVLRTAAIKDWIRDNRIAGKYPDAGPGLLIEEAIAAQYPVWALTRETTSAVGKAFQKIYDLLTRLKAALKEIFGRDLTPEEIFTRIEAGEVGRREPGRPAPIEAAERAEVPELELPPIEAEGLLGILPKGREQRYLNLINKQNAKNAKKLFEEAYKDTRKRLTPEWAANYAKQYADSLTDIKNRPDFRAATFFRNGIIGDQKLEGLPRLDPQFLTKEQIAGLPNKWLGHIGGFAPDDLAGYFGYKTGNDMVNDLVRFEEARGRVKPQTFLDLQAASEAERRMEMQYGELDENILREAREHAIGLERFDLMHEETLLLAERLGQQFTLKPKDIRDQEALKFNETISGQVSLIKYTREIGKSNKAAEAAWLKGDVLGAFVERQRTLRLQAQAELAKKFEKEKATFDRNAKRFSKREVDGVPPEFTNWIHHILFRVDRAPKRSPMDLEAEINRHEDKTLKDFLDRRNTAGLPDGFEEFEIEYNPNIPVWDRLIDTDWKGNIDATTVGEFRAINGSISALIKVGRDELRTIREGIAQNRADVINDMVSQFEEVGKAGLPDVGDPGVTKTLKMTGLRLHVGLLQMEYIWGRLDKTPYGGLFFKHFTAPFADAGNEFRLLNVEYSRKLNELGKKYTKGVWLRERIDNDTLMEPTTGFQDKFLGNGVITRRAFRVVMLNVGNSSNLEKLAGGYRTTPERVMAWVNKHATEKDWGFVRGVWEAFDDLQKKADLVSMHMSSVTMERLPIGKVQTNFGEIEGGYYPMIYDQSRGGGKAAGKIDPNTPPLIRVLTERGFERKRTGYIGPVDLSMSHLEHQLSRRIRDIAFREVLAESHRFFTNKRFTDAMTTYLGPQYTELLIPYLRDIAGVRGPTSAASRAVESMFNFIQQNTITAFVGWNPGTVLKHTPTAFVQSFKELKNPGHLLAAMHDLYTGAREVKEANHKFIEEGGTIGNLEWSGSGEIKGRRPNWNEALGGATDIVMGKTSARARALQVLSAPIAASDQAASKILWLAKYREMMDELGPNMKIEQAHTQAVTIADQAVRRTHGSTAITSRPAFMRMPIMRPLTALYGFFNHIFNRLYEISWQGREFKRDLMAGEATLADAGHLSLQVFYGVVVPAVIEELVTPLFDKDDRSLGVRFLMSMGFPITSSFPVLRELTHAIFTGHDPGFGIIQGSMKAVTDMVRVMKKGPDRENMGDVFQATHTLLGVATGMSSQQIGRWNKFAYNYLITHSEQPQDVSEWYRALRYGTTKERRH